MQKLPNLHFSLNYEMGLFEKYNVAVCHVLVVLNIIFNSEKGFKDTRTYIRYKFEEVWAKLENYVFSNNQSKDICHKFTKSIEVGLFKESSMA